MRRVLFVQRWWVAWRSCWAPAGPTVIRCFQRFLRAQASDPPQPEPRPDVKKMVREQLDSVFIPASQPQQVRVSLPQRDLRGPGWSACVKAELTSAMGKPLGPQTYRITIEEGTIVDRRRVGAEDNCDSENYEPI